MPDTKSLKPGWNIWKFDQIAENVAERAEPTPDDSTLYIGLEHMDSGSLRIRRWGSQTDLIGTKLKMRKGDILFARRNAYLKRVALAPHDGLFSAHGLVLRPRRKQVIPEFLPFFMQSDLFMNRAIQISVGSLSPTINWKALASQEFSLPPLREQERLADALQAIERVSEAHQEAIIKAERLRHSLLSDVLSFKWPVINLGSAVKKTQYGLSINAGSDGQYPMLRMMNIEDGLCVENDLKYVNLDDKEFHAYRLVHGDVLFNRTNSYELVGRTGVYELDGDHVFASYLVRIRTDSEKLEPSFLALYLNSEVGRRQVLAYATKAVSQANVNASNLLRVRLPLPSLDVQKDLLDKIANTKAAEAAAASRRLSAEEMKKQLLETFGRTPE